MTRQEQIGKLIDSLAADTVRMAELKKQSKNIDCIVVCNEAIDANNDRAEELLEELRGLRPKEMRGESRDD